MEPAGSELQRPQDRVLCAPVGGLAGRLPACPSGCSRGLSKPRGRGWVMTLALDF